VRKCIIYVTKHTTVCSLGAKRFVLERFDPLAMLTDLSSPSALGVFLSGLLMLPSEEHKTATLRRFPAPKTTKSMFVALCGDRECAKCETESRLAI
jgi:hypothetical protein